MYMAALLNCDYESIEYDVVNMSAIRARLLSVPTARKTTEFECSVLNYLTGSIASVATPSPSLGAEYL